MDNKILLENKLCNLEQYSLPENIDNKLSMIINNKVNKKIRFLLFLDHLKTGLLFLFIVSFILVLYNFFSGDNIDILKNIFISQKIVYLLALFESINPYFIGLFFLFGFGFFIDKNIIIQKFVLERA